LIAFYLMALAVGLLATPLRKSLRRPWVYVGALLAGVLVLPNLGWQQAHGWPFLELGKAGSGGKNIEMSLPAFFLQQVMTTGPLATLVWVCGICAGMARPRLGVFRAFAIAWVILIVVFDAAHGKAYYPAAIYPTLLALGAVRIEAWVGNAYVRGAALAAAAVLGLAAAPLVLPLLPIEVFIRYQKAIGLAPSAGEHQALGVLPQYYADMFGWPEMAERVAAVYRELAPEERAHAVFFGKNYGEAAAIDVFGGPLGLPPAIGGHNSYYLWGPRDHDLSVVIIIGGSEEHYAELFRSFEIAGRITTPYAMPYETDQPIYVLRGLKEPMKSFWPTVKHYD